MTATAGNADRTTLIALSSNLDIGDVADPALRLSYFQYMTDLSDANYNYVAGLVAGGTLQPYPAFMSRQAVINGNFDVWQRGTSFTTAAYGADRWYFDISNTTASRQSSGAPVGSQYYNRMTMTASGYGNYYQPLESDVVKKLNGKNVTFTVKLRKNASFLSDVTIIIQKNATADTLTGGAWTTISSNVASTANIPTGTASTDWYTISVTATIPNDGTANGIRIFIQQTTAQSAGTYYEVSQVQVNAGDTALPFQPRSFGEELELCQRYYERWNLGNGERFGFGLVASATSAFCSIRFSKKRTTPTVSGTGTAGDYGILGLGGGLTAATVVTFNSSSDVGCNIDVTVASGLTAGFPAVLGTTGASKYISIDAEL